MQYIAKNYCHGDPSVSVEQKLNRKSDRFYKIKLTADFESDPKYFAKWDKLFVNCNDSKTKLLFIKHIKGPFRFHLHGSC